MRPERLGARAVSKTAVSRVRILPVVLRGDLTRRDVGKVVIRLFWEQEIAGSTPAVPTDFESSNRKETSMSEEPFKPRIVTVAVRGSWCNGRTSAF